MAAPYRACALRAPVCAAKERGHFLVGAGTPPSRRRGLSVPSGFLDLDSSAFEKEGNTPPSSTITMQTTAVRPSKLAHLFGTDVADGLTEVHLPCHENMGRPCKRASNARCTSARKER